MQLAHAGGTLDVDVRRFAPIDTDTLPGPVLVDGFQMGRRSDFFLIER